MPAFSYHRARDPPLYSFSGKLIVIMNSDSRDPADDDNGSADVAYQDIRRTIAHELGHVLGLGDHNFSPTTVTNSLMARSSRMPGMSVYPLQDRDLLDIITIYTPNVVDAVTVGPDVLPLADRGAEAGSVVFNFDASRIHVERDLRIYRWHEDAATPGNSRWVHVETFLPSSGLVTWTVRNQPGGDQVYRIFSTTPVITAGQCYIDDRDCTDTNVRTDVDRIGFPTNDIIVNVVPPPVAVFYRLSIAVQGEGADTEGFGSVTRSLSGPTYEDGTTVVLTAVPFTKTYPAVWDGGDEMDPSRTVVVSEFVRWDGHAEAVRCGASLTCSLDMDEDINVLGQSDPTCVRRRPARA